MSVDKFWKHDFYMNTLFKFVRVLQVKDRLNKSKNARSFFYRMDSSRFQRGSSEKTRLLVTLGHKGVEKTSFDNKFSESSRRRSKLLPAIQTSIFQSRQKWVFATQERKKERLIARTISGTRIEGKGIITRHLKVCDNPICMTSLSFESRVFIEN